MKKLMSLVLALALVLSLAPGMTAMAEGDIVLTCLFWSGSDSDLGAVVTRQNVDAFNALDNGIALNVEWMYGEDTKTKLPTIMAANEAPDLFMAWAAGYLKPYVDAGKVYSLSEALAADPQWADSFLGGILEHTTYNGEVYAVPTLLSAQACFCNKEYYDKYGLEIPTSHEQLVEGLKVIRDAGDGIIPLAFGNSTAWPSGSHSETLANRIGGNEPFAKASTGQGSWTDPSFIKAAQLMQDLANEKLLPDGFAAITPDEAIEQFKAGKAAAINWSSYSMASYDAPDSAVKGKVVVTKCPTVEGGVGDENMWLGQPDRNIAISQRCANKEAAVEAVKFLSGVNSAQGMVDAGLGAHTLPAQPMTHERGRPAGRPLWQE